MTIDEAIKHCEDVAAKCFVEKSARNHSGKCGYEHLELAAWLRELKAYKEQETCDSCCGGDQKEKAKLCQKSYLAGLEHRQEPCEDAISRKAALETILTRVPDWCGSDEGGNLIGRNETAYYIRNLPSVTPERKTGEILTDYAIGIDREGFERKFVETRYCSLCKCDLGYNADILTHYCPNCGVKLEYKGR